MLKKAYIGRLIIEINHLKLGREGDIGGVISARRERQRADKLGVIEESRNGALAAKKA